MAAFLDSFTEEQAEVLVRLTPTAEQPERYRTRKDVGLHEFDFSTRALMQLLRLGAVENRSVGARARVWRLTPAGVAALPAAQSVLEAAKQARQRRWDEDNVVYGVPRAADAPPLTARQQRAWLRGFVRAQIPALALPADTPPEVRAHHAELIAWLDRQLAPYRA